MHALGELKRNHQRGMLEYKWKMTLVELRRRMAELSAAWTAEGEPTADIVEDGHEESMMPSPPTRAPSRSGGSSKPPHLHGGELHTEDFGVLALKSSEL